MDRYCKNVCWHAVHKVAVVKRKARKMLTGVTTPFFHNKITDCYIVFL